MEGKSSKLKIWNEINGALPTFKIVILTLLVSLIGNIVSADSELVKNGRSDYEIILTNDVIPAERKAAAELQKYIEKISGAKLKIISSSDTPSSPRRILIGWSAGISKLIKDVDFKSLKPDEIIIRTVGNNLIITGGRPRGTLYAIYTFLEDTLGVRWWTSVDTYIPKSDSIIIPDINIRYAPPIEIRDTAYSDIMRNPEFAARMKNNGYWCSVGKEFGGHYKVIGQCHTFNKLIPAKKYFKDHPEWFSFVNGKRIGGQFKGQLCLSNDEMRKELTKNALKLLRQSDSPQIISISQNDNMGYCQCSECKKLDDLEESPSGSLITFVNKVAADIEKEFPDVMVETFAYLYSQKPPATVQPRRNVAVRLCSILCDFSKPLNSNVDQNKKLSDDIKKWSEITPRLFIWNYVTNFNQFLTPFPNWSNLAEDIRFFVDNKAVSVLEQGDFYSGIRTGDFAPLKTWVISKLLWNPKMNQDKLIEEFLRGYYGAAAPFLKSYLDLMEKEAQKSEIPLTCMVPDTSQWLSLDALNKAADLFNQAETAVKNDPVLHDRVKRARFSIDNVWVFRGKLLRQLARKQHKPYNGPVDLAEFQKELSKNIKTFGIKRAAQWSSSSNYLAQAEKCCIVREKSRLPEELKDVPDAEWYDFWPDECVLRKGVSSIEADTAAVNGKAACISGKNKNYGLRLMFPGDIILSEKIRRICLMMRCEAKSTEGYAVRIGIYDRNSGKHIAQNIAIKKLNGSKYKLIDFNVNKFNILPGMFLEVRPLANPDVKNIWVERIFFVLDK